MMFLQPTPVYTALLKAAYLAAKAANPAAVILMAPLAPTDERGPANISDLIYLQQMYDAGAKDYFDIANVMVYGLGYPPDDRRTDFKRLNFSRPILTRQIMERNGDGGKAVWASEYAWISLPPGWTGKPSHLGRVGVGGAAGAISGGRLRRARAEWPWMGVMFVWNFRDPRRCRTNRRPTSRLSMGELVAGRQRNFCRRRSRDALCAVRAPFYLSGGSRIRSDAASRRSIDSRAVADVLADEWKEGAAWRVSIRNPGAAIATHVDRQLGAVFNRRESVMKKLLGRFIREDRGTGPHRVRVAGGDHHRLGAVA